MDKVKQITDSPKKAVDELATSLGNLQRKEYSTPKTSGIKTRGNGAATKGVTARGPMA
jgi:hypothetical protein